MLKGNVVFWGKFGLSFLLMLSVCLANTEAPQCDARLGCSITPSPSDPKTKPICVIGGGLAGMAAAIEVELLGGYFVLLEKEANVGGNSAKASSGMNAVGTPAQAAIGVEDSVKAFVHDTELSGAGLSDNTLIRILGEESRAAWDWVTSFGVNMDAVVGLGGHEIARTHRPKPLPNAPPKNVGLVITSALKDYINALPNGRAKVLTKTKVTAIEKLPKDKENPQQIYRVSFTTAGTPSQMDCAAVILATGGYSANKDLLKKYAPEIADLPTTNGPWATGDGVGLGESLGAELLHMEKVQVHPTGLVDPKDPSNPTKWLAPEALRGTGGILIGQGGKRFVNELGRRNEVTQAIFRHGVDNLPESLGAPDPKLKNKMAYLLMNNQSVQDFGENFFNFYKSKNFVKSFADCREVAKHMGVDEEVICQQIEEYNNAKKNGVDSFGKKVFPVEFSTKEPIHVWMITPAIHYTMGGLKFDANGRIIGKDGQPIEGLFGAGEVTGGLHGENRLGGNSLLECVVFGKRVAQSVASYLNSVPRFTTPFNELREVFGDRFNVTFQNRMAAARDASYHPAISPDAVVYPQTIQECSELVKIAARHALKIIPRGVGTSLEGHAIPIYGGIVVDFRNMNKINEVLTGDMLVRVQPGIQRKKLNQDLASYNVFFPIDPGADATIGGMTSTRASGTTAVGYGTMSDNVKSLKVVLASGEVIDTATDAKKSSSGYDLTHLMIGSEGTLGLIVEITLKIYPIPPVTASAIITYPNLPAQGVESAAKTVMKTLQEGISVQRIELLNTVAIEAVNKKFSRNYTVTPTLFVEVHGNTLDDVRGRVERIGKVAQEMGADHFDWTDNTTKGADMWSARHGCYWAASSLRNNTKLWVTDTAVPISKLASVVKETEQDFANSSFLAPIVGHVGDGNFHLMVPVDMNNPKEVKEMKELAERLVRRAVAVGGTCSGEHGIGIGKKKWVVLQHGSHHVSVQRAIKDALDPLHIFNPGKIFPSDDDHLFEI